MNSRLVAAFALSAALCVVLPNGRAEARATYTTFDAGYVAGINAADTVTGYRLQEKDGFVRAVDGTFTAFSVPGAIQTYALGINDEGTVAGAYTDSLVRDHGFVRAADGTVTTFDVPAAYSTAAAAINNKGEIAGTYSDGHHGHGFVRAEDGSITTFDAPGAADTLVSGMNDKHVIAGTFYDGSAEHGFVRAADGTITTFDVPGTDNNTRATSINIKGTVTGIYFNVNDGVVHAFARTADGTITAFVETADCNQPVPGGINRKGEIAGNCGVAGKPRLVLGFLRFPDGTMRILRVPRKHKTIPSGINDAGVIAGNWAGDKGFGGFLRFP
jgi:hypothetical protein